MDDTLRVFCETGPQSVLKQLFKTKEISENLLVIGILIGQQQNVHDPKLEFVKLLYSYSISRKLDPFSKGLILCRLFQVFSDWAKNHKNRSKRIIPEHALEIIEEFRKCSLILAEIKDNLGRELKNYITSAYNLAIDSLFELFRLNEEIIKLVKCCEVNKDLVKVKNNIFLIEYRDIEILDGARDCTDPAPVLNSLKKACEIISENNIKAGDILSIFVFNTLFYLLEHKVSNKHGFLVPHIESNLKEFAGNFTTNQKERLIDAYIKISEAIKMNPNPSLVGLYKGEINTKHVKFSEDTKFEKKLVEEEKKNYRENPIPEEKKKVKTNGEGRRKQKLEIVEKPYNDKPQAAKKKKKQETIQEISQKLINETIAMVDSGQFVDANLLGDKLEEAAALEEDGQKKIFEILDAGLGSTKPTAEAIKAWKIIAKACNHSHFLNEFNEHAFKTKLDAWNEKVQSNKLKGSHKKQQREEKKKQYEEGNQKEKNKPGYIVKKQAEMERPKIEVEIVVKRIEEFCMALLARHAPNEENIKSITQISILINKTIKQNYPDAELKGLGSSVSGTWTKDSDIDLTILSQSLTTQNLPDLIQLFRDVATEISETTDQTLKLKFADHGPYFILSINNKIGLESTALIKKYCSLDTLVTELILFVKIWAKSNQIYSYISGYHWTLLVISYLQNTSPPLIFSLQTKKHEPKLLDGLDVWFDSEVSQSLVTHFTLGFLIFSFFDFFAIEFVEDYFDPRNGFMIPGNSNGYLTVIDPFTSAQLGETTLQKGSEKAEEIKRKIRDSYNSIAHGGNLGIN